MAPRNKSDIVSDAVVSIVSDLHLRGNKWVSSSTLEEALRQRYEFGDHFELTSTLLNTVLTKLVPDVDSLKPNSNGMYRIQHYYNYVVDDKKKKIQFFYFQDQQKTPPKHPSVTENWERIIYLQTSIIQSFKHQDTRHHSTKKTRVREKVDDELLEMRSKFTAKALKDKIPALDYWESANAINLFNPLPGDPVLETLHRRNKNLLDFVNHPEQHVAEMFEGYAELPPLTVRQMDDFQKRSLYLYGTALL